MSKLKSLMEDDDSLSENIKPIKNYNEFSLNTSGTLTISANGTLGNIEIINKSEENIKCTMLECVYNIKEGCGFLEITNKVPKNKNTCSFYRTPKELEKKNKKRKMLSETDPKPKTNVTITGGM